VEVIDGLDLSVMVSNVFNKMPPMDRSYPATSGAPYNDLNYSVYGRQFMFEVHYAFGKKK
jgi:iron complex outermembrane receptor protein